MRAWICGTVGRDCGAGGEVFRTVSSGSGFDAAALLAPALMPADLAFCGALT